uniref:Uncharacterized protein n=1 Tax=Amphimedon queenslandica TaxID=400682 RepID=A0A1X7UB37_AMPQE
MRKGETLLHLLVFFPFPLFFLFPFVFPANRDGSI